MIQNYIRIVLYLFCIVAITGCFTKRDRWSTFQEDNDTKSYITRDSLFYIFCNYEMQLNRVHCTADVHFLTKKRYKIKYFNVRVNIKSDTLNYVYLRNINDKDYSKIITFDSIPDTIKYTGSIPQYKKEAKYGRSDHLRLEFNFQRDTIYYEKSKEIEFFINAILKDEQKDSVMQINKSYKLYHYHEFGPVWL